MKKLAEDWIECEIDHRISKEASNELFELGKKMFAKLYHAKNSEGVRKNVPQFVHLRRLLYDKKVPEVSMDVSYLNKSSGEIVVLHDQKDIPRSRFPANKFTKLYEIAKVKVSVCFSLCFHYFIYFLFFLSFFLSFFLFFLSITKPYMKKEVN